MNEQSGESEFRVVFLMPVVVGVDHPPRKFLSEFPLPRSGDVSREYRDPLQLARVPYLIQHPVGDIRQFSAREQLPRMSSRQLLDLLLRLSLLR